MSHDAFFSEHRRFRWWIWFILSPAVIVAWYGFVQQIVFGMPFGDKPGPDALVWVVWIGIGILLPVFMWKAGLVIEVKNGALHYRWRPFVKRALPGREIASVEARDHRPVREYGGWGIRYGGPERGWAYSVSGNKGVFVTCVDGTCFLLGTDRPEELVRAVESIMKNGA